MRPPHLAPHVAAHAKVTSSSFYGEEGLGMLAVCVPPLASCNRGKGLYVTFSLDWAIKQPQVCPDEQKSNWPETGS
jgi:hypothetical protein